MSSGGVIIIRDSLRTAATHPSVRERLNLLDLAAVDEILAKVNADWSRRDVRKLAHILAESESDD